MSDKIQLPKTPSLNLMAGGNGTFSVAPPGSPREIQAIDRNLQIDLTAEKAEAIKAYVAQVAIEGLYHNLSACQNRYFANSFESAELHTNANARACSLASAQQGAVMLNEDLALATRLGSAQIHEVQRLSTARARRGRFG
jgi:hypothetical protein